MDAPPAVARAVADWRQRGSPIQEPVSWSRAQWMAAFPQQHTLFDGLPDKLDRTAAIEVCAHASENPDAAERGFLVTMAWGYAGSGYGPARAARILERTPKASERLQRAAATIRDAGALAAYSRLADEDDCRLKHLGPAFGTKFLAFASPETGKHALILDSRITDWLQKNAGITLRVTQWHPATYATYLQTMYGWSDALSVPPHDLEYCLFAAESDLHPRSVWGS